MQPLWPGVTLSAVMSSKEHRALYYLTYWKENVSHQPCEKSLESHQNHICYCFLSAPPNSLLIIPYLHREVSCSFSELFSMQNPCWNCVLMIFNSVSRGHIIQTGFFLWSSHNSWFPLRRDLRTKPSNYYRYKEGACVSSCSSIAPTP